MASDASAAATDLDHGNLLQVALAVAGLEAQLAELLHQVCDRFVLTRGPRLTALEVIGREHADMGAEHRFVDIGGRRAVRFGCTAQAARQAVPPERKDPVVA